MAGPNAEDAPTPQTDDFNDAEDVARRERIEASIEELRARLNDVQAVIKSLAADMIDAGRDTAASYDDAFRRSIERQPYTAVLVATLIGFVVGSVNAQGGRQ
jgi:ElaB/YqjD/DUF883 family membrane-anchored ribosome-binding protein